MQDYYQNNEHHDYRTNITSIGCQRFINKTIEITYNALVAVTMPQAIDGNNPISVDVLGWMNGSDLADYTTYEDEKEHQYFGFFSRGWEPRYTESSS